MSAAHSDGDHFEHVIRCRRGQWTLSGSAELYPDGALACDGLFAAKAAAEKREGELLAELRKMNGGGA
jgi:hypothetical protein